MIPGDIEHFYRARGELGRQVCVIGHTFCLFAAAPPEGGFSCDKQMRAFTDESPMEEIYPWLGRTFER